MNWDFWILVAAWGLTIIILIRYIPKDKLREAQLIFLSKQFITWFIGILVVEFRLIEYPARVFTYSELNITDFCVYLS